MSSSGKSITLYYHIFPCKVRMWTQKASLTSLALLHPIPDIRSSLSGCLYQAYNQYFLGPTPGKCFPLFPCIHCAVCNMPQSHKWHCTHCHPNVLQSVLSCLNSTTFHHHPAAGQRVIKPSSARCSHIRVGLHKPGLYRTGSVS